MWGFPEISAWQAMQALLVFIAFPPLGIMTVCAIAGWRLAHVRWWAGVWLGFPFGIATIFSAFWFTGLTRPYNPLGDLGLLSILVPYTVVIVAVAAVPVLGTALWNSRQDRITGKETHT